MALIIMAVHDTVENGRTKYTIETVKSMMRTVDFSKHRLIISDNGSCEETKFAIHDFCNYKDNFSCEVIDNVINIGTAKAVNKGIAKRNAGEFVVKMDNDVVHNNVGWVDEMEEAIRRFPSIGILGAKRKDLEQRPDHENEVFKSELFMLPHERGQKWIVIEKSSDIMGTCTMFNPALINKIGLMRQPTVYGYDDVDYSIRSLIAGFTNCFLPHLVIDHIDTGGSAYCEWKQKTAADGGDELQMWIKGYNDGTISIRYDG